MQVASLTDTLLVVKGTAAPSWKGRPRRAANSDGRLRVAIRVDAELHLRLRLAAAHLRKTVPMVMAAALDNYLERIVPSVIGRRCECIASPGEASTAGEALAPVQLRVP